MLLLAPTYSFKFSSECSFDKPPRAPLFFTVPNIRRRYYSSRSLLRTCTNIIHRLTEKRPPNNYILAKNVAISGVLES
jgi:hypothetical protein